jgi:hypothetical protein
LASILAPLLNTIVSQSVRNIECFVLKVELFVFTLASRGATIFFSLTGFILLNKEDVSVSFFFNEWVLLA